MIFLFSAVVLLGILIFVHELGHFIFAKLMNVKVLKFSLGFGPKVLGKKHGDTEYMISAVPLGGYVKMLGEDQGDEVGDEERQRAYNFQPVWKRFLIVVSGPVFNIVFAAFIFILLFVSGVPVTYPDIGRVDENSSASKAGLMMGDRVLAVDGKEIKSWNDIEAAVDAIPGKGLLFRINRRGEIIELRVFPEKKAEANIFGEDKEVWDIGIRPLFKPEIGEVVKGSPADKAGLKKGDAAVEIEGVTIQTWYDMTDIIHKNPDRPLRFKVKRGGELMDLTITPGRSSFKISGNGGKKEIGLIGVKPAGNDFIRRYGPAGAVSLGLRMTWNWVSLTFVSIVKLIQQVIPAATIGGPIQIFQMAGEQAAHGAMSFFMFMAVISINLGVLNLLPIPILDGGHILFLGIEAVRRKPVTERVMMISQRVGLMIILAVMVLAFYNDIMRLITGKAIP